jgi:hypothetical protein
MTRRQFTVALMVLAVSGMAGGALATWLLPGQAVYAQAGGGAQGEVRAKRFVLVNAAGKPRAALTMENAQPLLAMSDQNGARRVELGTVAEPGIDPGGRLRFRDSTGVVRTGAMQEGLLVNDAQERMRGGMTFSSELDSCFFAVFDASEDVVWMAP